LSSRIKAARRAIGDDGTRQQYIRTVHGRGFRFVAALGAPEAAAQPRRQVAAMAIVACLVLGAAAAVAALHPPAAPARPVGGASAEIRGSLIAYATQPGGIAGDGSGRNGIYTGHLLVHLGNRELTIGQVFANTHRDLLAAAGAPRQVPEFRNSLTGDLRLHDAIAERRALALVVGNGAYRHLERLRNPTNDASDMRDLLARAGVPVRLVLEATLDQLDTAIDAFTADIRRLSRDPPPDAGTERVALATARGLHDEAGTNRPVIALLYLAGQGADIDGRQYFAAVDSRRGDPAELARTSLDIGALTRKLAAQAAVQIAVLDLCRDNPWTFPRRP
jgi:uncharacterized caspase-like protein